MNVYVWTNILKNAYIGEVYEYSYDFRGKTISQIISDGWTTAQWTPTIWTYWYSSANSNRARSNFTLPSLATANKITFYTNIIFTSSTGACDQIRIGNSGRTNLTWYYLDNVWNCFPQLLWNNITTITTASWAWTHKMTVELDLQNATYKYSITWYNDTTGSLTSSQISTIRGFTLAEAMSDGNTWYIKDFKLIIEY